ncbi:MAG: glycoside hydrolase family 28 protein [Cyclobacteriaceae bacterium]|nr:glycoside hydrolase family 28 protein [Cyclobacteriaceae bacterium]
MKGPFPILFLFIAHLAFFASCTLPTQPDRAQRISEILENISPPRFAERTISALDYGVQADSSFDSQPAINEAIKMLSDSGGGTLLFPKGNYHCKGPILLDNDIHLHFEDGTTLSFSQDPADYLPLQLVRWEGIECYNYSPYIYAMHKKNIAITGQVIFDAQAAGGLANWRILQNPDKDLLRLYGKEQKPLEKRIFGEGHHLRMSFIQLMHCENILIEDIEITNVPFWVIHPTYCNNLTIRNVHIDSYSINNDGIDVDSSEDVLIENCTFRAGDDAVVIKSGRDQDGWRVNKPSRNIVIRNCFASEVLHGLAFGSEMSAGLEHIYVDNFHMKYVQQYAIQFKSNPDRGGYIRNVSIDGIFIDDAQTAIFFTNDYHSYSGGNAPSVFSDITISNVVCNQAREMAIDIKGLSHKPIQSIELKNIMVKREGEKSTIRHVMLSQFSNITIDQHAANFEP